MSQGEIVIRFSVPDDWDRDTLAIVRRKLLVEVAKEIQERIEEAKAFEEILKRVKIEDQDEAQKLEDEIKLSLAKRYKGI
ncbi:hypothetical protein [Thermococcus sp.]|uniref:hypothetical protein n=1 Tax=Thermococcus sp. TaxID=35749 RepID=UPI00261CFB26|nr:hypothetical protein [Thermococcus sp.]